MSNPSIKNLCSRSNAAVEKKLVNSGSYRGDVDHAQLPIFDNARAQQPLTLNKMTKIG